MSKRPRQRSSSPSYAYASDNPSPLVALAKRRSRVGLLPSDGGAVSEGEGGRKRRRVAGRPSSGGGGNATTWSQNAEKAPRPSSSSSQSLSQPLPPTTPFPSLPPAYSTPFASTSTSSFPSHSNALQNYQEPGGGRPRTTRMADFIGQGQANRIHGARGDEWTDGIGASAHGNGNMDSSRRGNAKGKGKEKEWMGDLSPDEGYQKPNAILHALHQARLQPSPPQPPPSYSYWHPFPSIASSLSQAQTGFQAQAGPSTSPLIGKLPNRISPTAIGVLSGAGSGSGTRSAFLGGTEDGQRHHQTPEQQHSHNGMQMDSSPLANPYHFQPNQIPKPRYPNLSLEHLLALQNEDQVDPPSSPTARDGEEDGVVGMEMETPAKKTVRLRFGLPVEVEMDAIDGLEGRQRQMHNRSQGSNGAANGIGTQAALRSHNGSAWETRRRYEEMNRMLGGLVVGRRGAGTAGSGGEDAVSGGSEGGQGTAAAVARGTDNGGGVGNGVGSSASRRGEGAGAVMGGAGQ